MAIRVLSEEEIRDVLVGGQVVRIAFHDGNSQYLVPLGYVLMDGLLYGVTGRGRKTEMAKVRPAVAFQVDTSSSTGLFEWRSVTGEGVFAIVSDESERKRAFLAVQGLMTDAPGWWRREQEPGLVSGDFEVWKVTLEQTHGRAFEPPLEQDRGPM